MGIVAGCIIVALLLALIVVLMIPKYQSRLWERYGRFDVQGSNNNTDIPMDSPRHIDPLDIMHDVMGDTSGGATSMGDPQGDGPMTMDPTVSGEMNA